MAKMIINGEVYSGSTNYASAITYIKEDGTKSTVQKELDSRPVNNNILINSNFANPVNQRGITFPYIPTKTEYFLDRWCGYSKMEKIDDYIRLSVYSDSSWIYQEIEFPELYIGKQLTVTLKVRNPIESNNWYIYTHGGDVGQISRTYFPHDGEWHEVSSTFLVPSNITKLSIGISAPTGSLNGEYIDIQWAKLELGDHATPYVPRLYNEELELCKRYYQKIGGHSLVAGFLRICPLESNSKTQKFGMFLLEKEMRIRPTVYFNRNSMDIWVTAGNVALTIPFNTIDIVALDTKSVHVEISHNSHDYVAGGYLNFKNQNDYIAMDAEL